MSIFYCPPWTWLVEDLIPLTHQGPWFQSPDPQGVNGGDDDTIRVDWGCLWHGLISIGGDHLGSHDTPQMRYCATWPPCLICHGQADAEMTIHVWHLADHVNTSRTAERNVVWVNHPHPINTQNDFSPKWHNNRTFHLETRLSNYFNDTSQLAQCYIEKNHILWM